MTNENDDEQKNTIQQSTILITGGAGFIGSHLVDALATPKQQNKIIILDNLSTGKLANITHHFENNYINLNKATAKANKNKEEQKEVFTISNKTGNVTFIKADITNLALLQNIFKKYKPNYVFHQAAIPSVPRSVKDPVRSNKANVDGTLNVLVASKDNKVKKLVYASSSSVYGDTPTLPKTEDMIPSPLSPYAVSKLTGEYYCKVFTECYDLLTVALRYFNVYGPRQDPKSEYAAVIPKFVTRTLNEESPIIYGDGKQTRDFTFVKDVAQANILAAKSDTNGVFNVAGGKRITIDELATSIIDSLNIAVEPQYIDPRPGDILHSLADISKAKEKIDYEPLFEIHTGLKETIPWY